VYETYGVPSVTFESGRDTPRDLVARLGVESARAMMETLLGEEARAATTPKDALPPGDGSFTFDGWAGPPICVWYHLPEAIGPATPVLFVMHGVNRDADRYRDEWSALADQHGFVLVVPEFNEASFPGSAGYNLGNILDRDGRPVPRERWSFSALEPLFDRVRALTGTRVERYDLYGHSAGAQFVHRYVMFMPDARVRRAVAANAGWYTLPDRDVTYPYGLAGQRLPPVDLRRLFQQPLTILLATADNDPAYPNLRRTPEAMAQGPHRLARGEFFFGSAAAAAAALGTDFRWTLEKVDGVGHDNGAMAAPAAALLDD
jgi:poly(3-hydroxybutyrate) depolymerase